jgi:hypothetical protein
MRAALLSLALLLVAAPVASADSFDTILKDFRKDGLIEPCDYSQADLEKAQDRIPPDIEQYAPDLPEELAQAIEARAKGQCDEPASSGSATPEPPAPAASSGGATPPGAQPAAPAPAPAPGSTPTPVSTPSPEGAPTDQAIAKAAAARTDEGSGDVPAPLVGLGVLALLALLAGLAVAASRWGGWEPGWAVRARHATGEAGHRVGLTFSEFADWLRLGR